VYEAETRLTNREAAKVRRVSESKMNKDRCCGGGPPFEKDGRVVKYKYSSLIAWMAAQTRSSTSDTGEAA
jgi:hypothetical protein